MKGSIGHIRKQFKSINLKNFAKNTVVVSKNKLNTFHGLTVIYLKDYCIRID